MRRPVARGERREPVDDRGRALEVGLHHQAKPVPAVERGVAIDGLEDLEREVQPVGFLGVEGEADVVARAPAASSSSRGTSSARTRSRCARS